MRLTVGSLCIVLWGCNPGSYEPRAGRGGTREEALGQVCEASLSLSGRFTPGAAQPADVFGCWPVGQWRISAQVVENGCAQAPALEPEYAVEVTRDAEEQLHYRYLTDPSWEHVKLKASSGGGGLCEGGFEIFGEGGTTVVRLKPGLQADGSLRGSGEYEVYDVSQL
jgi:hypothetical protein